MKIRSLQLVFIIGSLSVGVFAQTRTITNEDLGRYKQERVKAQTELREDYARLGFSSPVEYERRFRESREQTERIAEKLRAQRLAEEQLELQRMAREQQPAGGYVIAGQPQYLAGVESALYYGSLGHQRRYGYRSRQYQQPGYFAGGQFWPTGPRTAPRPMFRGAPRIGRGRR